MSYADFRDYLRLLIRQHETDLQHVQIDPAVIDPDRIRSVKHSIFTGIQAVDAIASGIHSGVKVNRYGEAKPSYSHVAKMLYRHKGK